MNVIRELAGELVDQARTSNQRRLLVIHGSRPRTHKAARAALEALDAERQSTVFVGPEPSSPLPAVHVRPEQSTEVMGTTQQAVVLDAHAEFDPDVLGQTVGAVDGGGLYVLLTPPLDRWPKTRDRFDETLAVPPFGLEEVQGHFRRRFLAVMREGQGVAIVDADEPRVEQAGLVEPAEERTRSPSVSPPARASFPNLVYEACLTQDQAETVHLMETLLDPDGVVLVEADRGRGKSSAAGLAAYALLKRGLDVLVTAPSPRNTDEVFARVLELARGQGLEADERTERPRVEIDDARLWYAPASDVPDRVEGFDVLLVDEAAGLPVHVLESFLDQGRPTAFTTTVHGYEGAGRGFSVRFKERLEAIDRPVHEASMREPIRYAVADPLERFSFEALLLDAEPARIDDVGPARPGDARYRVLTGSQLLEDEGLLREAFGLLVLAHYRTRPSDLARLLDAPNVSIRCLTVDGHVASVALIAREGGLGPDLREAMYEGQRVRGNMIPDVITSQLRDENAAEPVGWRVLRIATHPEKRREGFGTRLLDEIAAESEQADTDVDWLGTSYGATPGLLSFWRQSGYRTVHLATRRNEASGEHSAVMLKGLTSRGSQLTDRTERWLVERLPSVLTDALDRLEPDVVRQTLATVEHVPTLDLSDREWRLVAAAAFGPGIYDTAPGPFRRLALLHLVDRQVELDPREERLLVSKVLQARTWERVRDELDLPSKRRAMMALGRAFQPLVDLYGTDEAEREAARYR